MFLNGTRVRGSWTLLDTASLAQKAGPGYEVCTWTPFYKQTLELHTTSASVFGRLELTETGIMSFASGPTRTEARHAILMAHSLLLRLLRVLDSQNTHFNLGLDETLQANVADFQKAYAAEKHAK